MAIEATMAETRRGGRTMTATDDQSQEVRRRLQELMEDLRVAMPGVQVLFGFLLTLPFSSRFSVLLDHTEKTVYFVAFLSAALASVLLTAPSALHRLYHELHDPGGLALLLAISGYLAVLGVAFLALAMTAVVFFITKLLYTNLVAALATAGLATLTVLTWFALPLIRRLRR